MSEPKTELRPLVLKSSQWLRGKYVKIGGSALFVGGRKHQYCCLGILARECGLSSRKLLDKSVPADLLDRDKEREDFPESLRWCVGKDRQSSRDANLAIKANDDIGITDKVRLRRLAPIFRRHGWDLQFVDDETKAAR